MKRLLWLLIMMGCLVAAPAQKAGNNQRKTSVASKQNRTSAQKRSTATQKKSQTTQKKSTTSQKKTSTAQRKGTTQRNPTTDRKGLEKERSNIIASKNANIKKQAELKRDVKRGLENLMILDHEIARKRMVIDTIRTNILELNSHISILDSQLEQLQEELEQRRNRYMKSLRYMHRNRSVQNQLMFIVSADNLNQMYRRMRFSREYAAYQRAQGEAVVSKQKQVEQKKNELTESRQQKSQLLMRDEQEKRQLQGKQDEQQTQVNKLKKQQKTVEALIAEQQRREAELNARIDKLIAEELAREKARKEAEARKKAEAEAARKRAEELARKKAAAEAARKENERRIAEAKAKEEAARAAARAAKSKEEKAEAERKAREAAEARKATERKAEEENLARERDIVATKKAELDYKMPVEDQKMSGGFQANQGRMPMPITGAYKLIRGFGPYSPEGMKHVQLQSNGWYLKGKSGAHAQCIFDGQVSGVYKVGNSNVVTVRHGRYISAYINLAHVSVKKGQNVKARQDLGTLGPDCTMQFQLRNMENLLNPAKWIAR